MQEKAEQWTESAKQTAHSTKESAQHGQEQASGFIQQVILIWLMFNHYKLYIV